jgi:hypothetical protein
VAKADSKPVDDNQLNLTESDFSFVKAQDLWFTVFETTPSKKSKVFNLLPFLIAHCSLLFFAEGVGLENGKLHIL